MTLLSPFISKPQRVLLYTLIPEERQFQPIPRNWYARARNRTRRAIELARWQLTHTWRAHYSHFEDTLFNNRGDIAIRMGACEQLRQILSERAVVVEVAWGELGDALRGRESAWDLIVIAGGGFLFADPSGRLPKRFADDLKALETASCPIVALSIGLNHLMTPSWNGTFAFHESERAPLRRFLACTDFASVRDVFTQQAIAAATGLTPPVIVDPAFLLASTPGFLAPDTAPPRGPSEGLAVGINLACHGTHMTDINRSFLHTVLRALRQFSAATPCRFYFFVHADGERGLALALRQSGLPLEIVDGSVSEMLAVYRKLDLHVGQMLHSAILAMSVNVPTIALAYDVKSPAFLDLFDLKALCLDSRNVTENQLLETMKRVAADRHRIAGRIYVMRNRLLADAREFYGKIRAISGPANQSPAETVMTPIPTPRATPGRPQFSRHETTLFSDDHDHSRTA